MALLRADNVWVKQLREQFSKAGFGAYLEELTKPEDAKFHQTKMSILYAVEYREALFAMNSSAELLMSQTYDASREKSPNMYETLAEFDIDSAVHEVAAHGREPSYWLDINMNDKSLPPRESLIEAIRKTTLNDFNSGRQRELYDAYVKKLRIDIAKAIQPECESFFGNLDILFQQRKTKPTPSSSEHTPNV